MTGCKSAAAENHDAPVPGPTAAPSPAANGHPTSIADDAERQLAARKSSSYAHDTKVDEASGRFDYDCSGFVNYTLKEVAPAAFTDVAAVRARPNAKAYHDFFQGKPTTHWRAVDKATEIQRGDLIAWLEPTDTDSTNSGHVVIAVAAPVVNAAKHEVSVEVIDSAKSGHGTTDTRPKGESGLGKGPIILELDAENRPRGFRWSPEKNSQLHEVSIAIGRIVGSGS